MIYLNQYIDHVEDIFFMRIEWELQDFLILQEKTDRAVQKHIERKVLAYKNRTVIFN